MKSASVAYVVVPLVVLLASACGERDSVAPTTSVSPSARLRTDASLREDLAMTRDASDGGGVAWLIAGDEGPPEVVASRGGRFPIVYQAGPRGIAEGGAIYLLVSPFWGWSEPQVVAPQHPGYTSVTTAAAGVLLSPEQVDSHLLKIDVGGRALRPGEEVNIVYGAGELGAVVDRFAESDSKLWIAVDGDGDGVRGVVVPSPGLTVRAGDPAQLALTLPSVAAPGQQVPLTIAVLDAVANAWIDARAEIELAVDGCALELPHAIALAGEDHGVTELRLVAPAEGVCRVSGRLVGKLTTTSNPMLISDAAIPIRWADLHGHSGFSDGTGTPADYLRYARDVAALDAAALTDHDHWGVRFLDAAPDLWDEIVEQTRQFHDPGRFVTLLGFEWTSWVHGHRHVIYFTDEGGVLSSVDDRYDTPPELWSALDGRTTMTFAHHSAGGPIATNWSFPPDPDLETCTEIVSVHGSSEALDGPLPIYSGVPGNFVRDVLDHGFQLGFVGSGDSHDGHPGLAHLGAPCGGLTAIISDELSREAIHEALRDRRVYATNGPRIILQFAVDGHGMGRVVPVPAGGLAAVYVRVVATGPLDAVDLIRSGELVASFDAEGELEFTLSTTVDGIKAGGYVYARAVQENNGAAWSSPVFFE